MKPCSIERLDRLLRHLSKQALTRAEAAKLMDMSYEQAGVYLRHLHTQGKIYVCDWIRRGVSTQWTAIYTAGGEKDAPWPLGSKVRTGYNRMIKARIRMRNKLEEERLNAEKAKPIVPHRDELVAALFGAPKPRAAEEVLM